MPELMPTRRRERRSAARLKDGKECWRPRSAMRATSGDGDTRDREHSQSRKLLSSAKAVRATIGAGNPICRMSRVLCRPSRFGIYGVIGQRGSSRELAQGKNHLDVHEDQMEEPLLLHALANLVKRLLAVLRDGDVYDSIVRYSGPSGVTTAKETVDAYRKCPPTSTSEERPPG